MRQNKTVPKIGVYQIKNLLNNKIFIASSMNLDASWDEEQKVLNKGLHLCHDLNSDWKKDGKENFKYEILAEISTLDSKLDYEKGLYLLESKLKEEVQPYGEMGYNIVESITLSIPKINF
jgi:hypothetical protein